MYNFDEKVNRRNTNSLKWDLNGRSFGNEDAVSMWVADMDFKVSPHIIDEMQKVMDEGIFGYRITPKAYYDSIINWMGRRHNYKVEREWICYVPNVVAGLAFAVQAVSDIGDEVIVQTPVYGPFFEVVKNNGRKLIECPMKNEDGYYTMDLKAFEESITPRTKATILCNPHNPTGRVWSKKELQDFAEICLKHNIFIISDDIHSELIMKEHEHTFISTLSEEIANKCIVCTSPAKAFNLASIHVANCIIKDEEVRKRFKKPMLNAHLFGGNAFVAAALIGAYDKSELWLDELMEYIEGNVDYFVNYINNEIPRLKVHKPEGTYLMWVDCTDLNMSPEELNEFMINKCNVILNKGITFGEPGKYFVRFNLGCNRQQIKDVLKVIKEQIELL